MIKRNLAIFITAISIFSSYLTYARDEITSFDTYKVNEPYTGPKKPINKKDLQENSLFKTRITEGYKEDINFAGKYVWLQWGCGSSCQMNVIINAEDGKIFEAPTSSLGVTHKSDSAMIILNPLTEGETEDERPEYSKPSKYYFDGKQFIKIDICLY